MVGVVIISLLVIIIMITTVSVVVGLIGYWVYSVPILMVACVVYLIYAYTYYVHFTNAIIRNKEQSCAYQLKKSIVEENGKKIIKFTIDGDYVICDYDKSIRFDLKKFLFKKAFIRAMVVRHLRYRTVNKKLRLYKFFKLRLRVREQEKMDNLYIKFIYGEKEKEIQVLKNGVSVNSWLSVNIIRARYNRARLTKYENEEYFKVCEISEPRYISDHFFVCPKRKR